MTPEELKARTKKFAVRVLRLADSLPRTPSGRTLSSQIADSGTSVASNYRAACKARSRKEFIAKLGVAEEEGDETQFWLEMIAESGLLPPPRLQPLHQEARELTAILAASRKSAAGKG
jgi:four helix bundle protein